MPSCLQCKRVYIAEYIKNVSVGFEDTLIHRQGAFYESRRKVTKSLNC